MALTRVERMLVDGLFSLAVIAGFTQPTRTERVAVASARTLQGNYRALLGYRNAPAAILTSGASQYKLGKNILPSFGMMLTPERGLMRESLADIRAAFRLAGPINLCPLASNGCSLACLSTSGQSGMPAQQRAQSVRTAFLVAEPYAAGLIIGAELRAAVKRYGKINLRLNTTSDIRWEYVAPEMLEILADAGVQLYDYTAWSPADRAPSDIYHLTYSAKETSHTSDAYLIGILASGSNVAMPFDTKRGEPLPATWNGFRVIDGDESDERRNDLQPIGMPGVIVGLRAKGHAWKRDNAAGFIRASLPLMVVA